MKDILGGSETIMKRKRISFVPWHKTRSRWFQRSKYSGKRIFPGQLAMMSKVDIDDDLDDPEDWLLIEEYTWLKLRGVLK